MRIIVIKKPRRQSLVEQVAKQMERLIESGHWQVGERIPPEQVLIETFDVSRNTLREAVRALVHLGLLETKQGSGTVVTSRSSFEVAVHRHLEKSDLIETLEVRLALEREAAFLATKRRTMDDLEKMKIYVELCEKYDGKDEQKFLDADINLHKMIVQASHNKLLIELYESMTEMLYRSIKTFVSMAKHLKKENQIHRHLYEAIREKDEQLAIKSVNLYIDEFKELLQQMKGDKNWHK